MSLHAMQLFFGSSQLLMPNLLEDQILTQGSVDHTLRINPVIKSHFNWLTCMTWLTGTVIEALLISHQTLKQTTPLQTISNTTTSRVYFGLTDRFFWNYSILAELSMGGVDPRVGWGWVGNGLRIFVLVGWSWSETADLRKTDVVYICNFVFSSNYSASWQLGTVTVVICIDISAFWWWLWWSVV